VNPERTRAAASDQYSNATDLADYLARKGLEFRRAHEHVGRVVRYAIDEKKTLAEISLEEYQRFSPLFGEDLYEAITLESSLANKGTPGGTSPERVSEALSKAQAELK
jgi:argininosuccinate lyase